MKNVKSKVIVFVLLAIIIANVIIAASQLDYMFIFNRFDFIEYDGVRYNLVQNVTVNNKDYLSLSDLYVVVYLGDIYENVCYRHKHYANVLYTNGVVSSSQEIQFLYFCGGYYERSQD